MCTYVKVFRECGGTNVEEARSIVKVGNKERKRTKKEIAEKQEAVETRLSRWTANLTRKYLVCRIHGIDISSGAYPQHPISPVERTEERCKV